MALERRADKVLEVSEVPEVLEVPEDELEREFGPNPFNTKLFPTMEELDVDLGHSQRDKPASAWAISKIGTLQSKIEEHLNRRKHRAHFAFGDPNEVPFHRLVNMANEAFGHDGWSTEIKSTAVTEIAALSDTQGESYSLSAESSVILWLKDGTHHEATGYGRADNLPQKGTAYLKCKKESITDATKNAIKDLTFLLLDHQVKVRDGYYRDKGIFEY